MTTPTGGGRRVAYEEYLAGILAAISPLPPVRTPVGESSAGLVTAEPVRAGLPAPAFTNSAMDGFALRAADLAAVGDGTHAWLPVSADMPAGAAPPPWRPGTAVRIMTGAPLPSGEAGAPDTVVPVEYTDQPLMRAPLPERVRVPAEWPAGRNVRGKGSDLAAGAHVLPAGVRLDGAALAALTAVGVGDVLVHRRVRVAIIVTGDELAAGGAPPAAGQVPDSNGILLRATLADFGADVMWHRTCPDDPARFTALVREALSGGADLLVTTGGASVGAHDVARHVLSRHGVHFAAVAIQPAKPQGFGIVEGVPVLALPGNPGSVHASLHALVRPVVAHLGRSTLPAPLWLPATTSWTGRDGIRQFVPVTIGPDGVAPVIPGGVAAHRVSSLALADGLASIAPEIGRVRAGDVLPVIVTRP